MAAILHSRSSPALRLDAPGAPRGLRVLEGGRSARRLRLVHRRRRILAALVVVALLVAGLAAGRAALGALRPLAPGAASVPATTPTAGPVVVVRPGDTLWGIARRLSSDGDVRPVVDRLVAAKGGGALYPGEQVSVASVVGP